MLTLEFLFWSADYHVSPAVLVAGYGVPQLLGKATVILGGIGVVESGMVGLYAVVGVPKACAIVAFLDIAAFPFGCGNWPASRSFPILSAAHASRQSISRKETEQRS
jgi:hypothetical protein